MNRITQNRSSSLLNAASAVALVATGMLASSAANAQEIESVVVTGSRIGTPGFTTPTPVTEITPLQYEVKNLQSVVDILQDIPSLQPNQNQAGVVDVGGSFFNLRGLGNTRTLILINGQRTNPTSLTGGYDINVIPAALVSHIDVVTGGASAAYGSDAIAGVVNVTLNTRLTGLRGKVSTGLSYYGDDETDTASLAYGTTFGGGRGHLVVGGEYYHSLGVAEQRTRPYGNQSWGLVSNPACTSYTTTCTNNYISQNVYNGTMNDGGVITSAGPLKNISFGPGGTLGVFQQGFGAPGVLAIGGSGSQLNQSTSLQPEVNRSNLMGSVEYDITDDITAEVHMLYSRSAQQYGITTAYDNGTITITNQNPFIPAALQTLMTTNKITQFAMGRTEEDFGPLYHGRDVLYGRNEAYDPSFGIKGKINLFGQSWQWDVNGQYSTHQYEAVGSQNRNQALFPLSVDAVANPAVGGLANVPVGQAVCRSTLSAPTNGCVPVNLFGLGNVDPAAIAYFMGTSWNQAVLNMQDYSANLKGEPFSTWAGPVAVAVGGEYRTQSQSVTSDVNSIALNWKNANTSPYKGHLSVEEGYLELGIPLLKDSPIGKSLDLDVAGRATSYSTSGGVTTWKVGLNYSLNDDIRFRTTRSHDIRAPGVQELFQTGVLRTGSVITNPITGAQSVTGSLTSGNPNLVPEIGDTITAGVVYSPSWLDGFNVSVDFWNIKLTNQIVTVAAQTVVNNCLQLNLTSYCPAISYNPVNGQIQTIASTGFNAASLKTDGWDFEAGYNFEGDAIGLPGSFQLHALATLLDSYVTNQFGIINNTAGSEISALPRFRSNVSVIWLSDPWRVSLNGDWVGGGPFNVLYNSTKYNYVQGARTINTNTVGGRFTINMSANYKVNDAWELFANVKNLLNTQPPIMPDAATFQHASNGLTQGGAQFDRIGGQWQVGVKLSLN